MSSQKKIYIITFCVEKDNKNSFPIEENKSEIPSENVQIEGDFDFYDYFSGTTIEYLKEFFLTIFGKKYNYCKCMLSVFYRTSGVFEQTKYHLLSNNENSKISEFEHKQLYLIKLDIKCNCEFKMYKKYLSMKKCDILLKLKELENKVQQLENSEKELKQKNEQLIEDNKNRISQINDLDNEYKKIIKIDEINGFGDYNFEKFYDIVIDVNSIKNINNEGWKVKFDENGKKKYEEHKNKELIIIGVIGNNNKGKSFVLTKISKIKLLTGTSIHTEGLSVKYPDLDEHKGRYLILLDSAGLETPVLRNDNKEKKEENKKASNEKEKVDKENQKNIDSKIQKDKENLSHYEMPEKNLLDEKEVEINKIFQENAKDKIMTELFLENFIIKVSHILLVVVGKLTYSEQILINKVKVESKKQNKERIFIIHNLQDFRTREQVENYIKNTLLKCSTFNLRKRTWITSKKDEENIDEIKNKEENNDEIKIDKINDEDIHINPKKEESNKISIFDEIQNNENENNEENNEIKDVIKDVNNNPENKEKIDEQEVNEETKLYDIHFTEILNYNDKKKLEVFHLIIANEDSEAGKIYNKYAYNFIENVYNIISEPKQFDIFEQVKEKFKSLSNIILNNSIEEIPFTDNKTILEKKIIKLDLKEPLSLKKCYTDELGFSLFKTGNFEPKYNYFKADKNTLEIRLEIPGNTECNFNHKVVGDDTIITVTGKKIKDKKPENPNDELFNIREFGEFELNIPLKVQDYKINQTKPKEGYPKYVNGICCVQYELASKGENTKVVADSEDL